MEYVQGNIRLSATDVANHLSCKHLTTLNLLLAKGAVSAPDWAYPDLKVLQQLGLDHEKAYVDNLRSKGLSIVDIPQDANSRDATLDAMKKGFQVIVQATLANGDWLGRADVLVRVDQPSALGGWSYEVVDCKLSRTTKAEAILQLCFYSELLTDVQEHEPEMFHVIRPHTAYEPESHRFSQYAAYYRYVKQAIKHAVDNANGKTYPEVVPHCDICRWWKHCDQQLRKDDSLSLVHGASRLQRKELASHSVVTLKALAELPYPMPFKPKKGGIAGFNRIHEQARIQLEARTANQPKWEKLPFVVGEGLCRLPAPTQGDLFFDFEGDPFTGPGGIEYLFGVLGLTDTGSLAYEGKWAFDRAAEKAAFEWFIDFVIGRLSKWPDLHIYHFGTYEPSAIKRLVLRYATKEMEVDQLLRGDAFVDLHKIFKEAILAGVEEYSLKVLEQFNGYQRKIPLASAKVARRLLEHALQLNLVSKLDTQTNTIVEGYNEDDCQSTKLLRDWLEQVRENEIKAGQKIDRPPKVDGAPKEAGVLHHKRVVVLFDALTRDIPVDPERRTQQQNALWLLAHILDWYRRENKVKWWGFFRLTELNEDDLHLDRTAIAGMSFVVRLPKASGRERSATDQYSYPPQECSIHEGDTLYTQDGEKFGEVISIDPLAGTVSIKKVTAVTNFHPSCVFEHAEFPTNEQADAILRLGDWVLKNGIDAPGEYRAARDLLLRNAPRLKSGKSIQHGELSMQSICEISVALDHSMLPVQGPPGSGVHAMDGNHPVDASCGSKMAHKNRLDRDTAILAVSLSAMRAFCSGDVLVAEIRIALRTSTTFLTFDPTISGEASQELKSQVVRRSKTGGCKLGKPLVRGRSVPVAVYKYGKVIAGVLMTWRRRNLQRSLRDKLAALQHEARARGYGGNADVVAHSFGTWLFGHLVKDELARNPNDRLRFGRVILLGCILRPDFNWKSVKEAGLVQDVLNHFGTGDRVVPLAHATISDSGPSGRRGFDETEVINIRADAFGHSDLLSIDKKLKSGVTYLSNSYQRYWRPFLTLPREELSNIPDRIIPPKPWRQLWWPLRGTVFPFFALPLVLAVITFLVGIVGSLFWRWRPVTERVTVASGCGIGALFLLIASTEFWRWLRS